MGDGKGFPPVGADLIGNGPSIGHPSFAGDSCAKGRTV